MLFFEVDRKILSLPLFLRTTGMDGCQFLVSKRPFVKAATIFIQIRPGQNFDRGFFRNLNKTFSRWAKFSIKFYGDENFDRELSEDLKKSFLDLTSCVFIIS